MTEFSEKLVPGRQAHDKKVARVVPPKSHSIDKPILFRFNSYNNF